MACHTCEVSLSASAIYWTDQGRQSQTLPQAIETYTRRYGRKPPKGFDDWWKFAQKNGVKIVDDVGLSSSLGHHKGSDGQYDQLHKDIEPYHAFSPEMFRKRAAILEDNAKWS